MLPHLEEYHSNLQAALRASHAGDITKITREAASFAGLSEDLEFDMGWMTEQNQSAVQRAIDRVVMVADQIHRLGYKALTSTGRA